jgi:uncharacterized lipoprotein YddW (UPF0748 family)
MKLLSLAIVLGLVTVVSAEPKVRGTWMTTTANDAISTPAKTAESMATLKELGLNTVYVECWKNGYTEFPSETMDELIGVPMKINAAPAELQRDLLQETVIEAHRNGLIVVAWFEYGFMASFKDTNNELRAIADEKGWLTRTKDGEVVGEQNPFVWMNPLHPGPQQLLLDITLEAVDQYDLDGVQLDDRIAMPTEMGYDDYTVALYQSEHDGRSPPEDPRDPQWVKWRADKVTEYAERFARELKTRRPGLIVSVSPAPHPWSLSNYACNWVEWQDQAWDEFIPQAYRTTYGSFEPTIHEQAVRIESNRREDLIAGIMMNGSGKLVSPLGMAGAMMAFDEDREKENYEERAERLRKQLDAFLDVSRDALFEDIEKSMETASDYGGGWVLWFSRGVLDVYPEELAGLNLEPVDNPHFPADWRPMPIVAEQSGGWSVTVEEAGTFRVIAKVDGQWQRLPKSVDLEAGEHQIDAPDDAEAVELLVDRRPQMAEVVQR